MHELQELFRHNTWANAQVFDLAANQDEQLLTADASGTRDTVTGTLAHLAGVETFYQAVVEGRPLESIEPRETYMNHTVSWYAAQVRELGQGFDRLLQTATPEKLDRAIAIPWFDFQMTAREGLLQVLTHSAQHRSQVLAWLSGRGIQTPDLDYVLMLREDKRHAALA